MSVAWHQGCSSRSQEEPLWAKGKDLAAEWDKLNKVEVYRERDLSLDLILEGKLVNAIVIVLIGSDRSKRRCRIQVSISRTGTGPNPEARVHHLKHLRSSSTKSRLSAKPVKVHSVMSIRSSSSVVNLASVKKSSEHSAREASHMSVIISPMQYRGHTLMMTMKSLVARPITTQGNQVHAKHAYLKVRPISQSMLRPTRRTKINLTWSQSKTHRGGISSHTRLTLWSVKKPWTPLWRDVDWRMSSDTTTKTRWLSMKTTNQWALVPTWSLEKSSQDHCSIVTTQSIMNQLSLKAPTLSNTCKEKSRVTQLTKGTQLNLLMDPNVHKLS